MRRWSRRRIRENSGQWLVVSKGKGNSGRRLVVGVQGWKGGCWVSLGFRCFHEVWNIGRLLLDGISIGYRLNPTYGLGEGLRYHSKIYGESMKEKRDEKKAT